MAYENKYVKKNDIVLIMNDNVKWNPWPMAIVIDVHPGPLSNVRGGCSQI